MKGNRQRETLTYKIWLDKLISALSRNYRFGSGEMRERRRALQNKIAQLSRILMRKG